MKAIRIFGIAIASVLICFTSVQALDPVQTQMSLSAELEIDVIKAKVASDVLTVTMMLRNDGDKASNFTGVIDDSHYIVKEENKKYHALKDSKGKWLADPIKYGAHSAWFEVRVPAKGKKLAWIRFPAPPENVEKIDLTVQGILPFDELAVTR